MIHTLTILFLAVVFFAGCVLTLASYIYPNSFNNRWQERFMLLAFFSACVLVVSVVLKLVRLGWLE